MCDLQKQAEALVKLLSSHKLTIATAESCTGGMAAAAITSVSGASSVFEYGAVTYANRIKEEMLGVSDLSLRTDGAVSEAVACEMAEGVLTRANSDVGISTTGIAGPTGAVAGKPVGTVYIAVSYRGKTEWERLDLLSVCGNDREKIRTQTVLRLFHKTIDMITRYDV